MPAFMFEKISPPAGAPVPSVANGSSPSIAKKRRGVIVQILDRLVETRVKRTSREEKGAIGHNPQKSRG
jgi:hypothetical protein